MKYSITIESDNAERDLENLVSIALGAYDKYKETSKKYEETGLSLAVINAKQDVKGLDNRIDGIEAKLNNVYDLLDAMTKEKKK